MWHFNISTFVVFFSNYDPVTRREVCERSLSWSSRYIYVVSIHFILLSKHPPFSRTGISEPCFQLHWPFSVSSIFCGICWVDSPHTFSSSGGKDRRWMVVGAAYIAIATHSQLHCQKIMKKFNRPKINKIKRETVSNKQALLQT